jgi:hypothetical protein
VALGGFDSFSLVPLPLGGVWRVSDWDDPLDPPAPPAPAWETPPGTDAARRWDDPAGEFRTLYCATEAEGALGEKLGSFALRPSVVREIEGFLIGDPDEEFLDEDLAGGLGGRDIDDLNWKLAWVQADLAAETIDISAPRTMIAALPGVRSLLRNYKIPSFDRAALLSTKRGFTRRVAGYLREEATDGDGSLQAAGLRYESRLPPSWECWALWEPLPIDHTTAEIEHVSIDHPALRAAAAMLGVPLLD